MLTRSTVPDLLPQLSAGRHRSPKRGACFMEFASFLAGERWSDHPECTDPLLAALARGVNDAVCDDRRGELVELIPRVVGLRGDDETIGLVVALRAASMALPVVNMERQRGLAVGVLAVRAAIERRGIDAGDLADAVAGSLSEVPDAARFAEHQIAAIGVHEPGVIRYGCAAIVRLAAVGVAEACIEEPDTLLIEMLTAAIDDAERIVGRDAPVETPAMTRELAHA